MEKFSVEISTQVREGWAVGSGETESGWEAHQEGPEAGLQEIRRGKGPLRSSGWHLEALVRE